jgi:hypothetical protein
MRHERSLSMSDFTAHLYQLGPDNASSGAGAITLTSSGGSYQGSVNWQINGVGTVATQISGSSVTNGKNLTLIALQSTDGKLKLTLIQNPYDPGRVAYGGCASYQSGALYTYNLTVVAKS